MNFKKCSFISSKNLSNTFNISFIKSNLKKINRKNNNYKTVIINYLRNHYSSSLISSLYYIYYYYIVLPFVNFS